jgi:hypothetical protein
MAVLPDSNACFPGCPPAHSVRAVIQRQVMKRSGCFAAAETRACEGSRGRAWPVAVRSANEESPSPSTISCPAVGDAYATCRTRVALAVFGSRWTRRSETQIVSYFVNDIRGHSGQLSCEGGDQGVLANCVDQSCDAASMTKHSFDRFIGKQVTRFRRGTRTPQPVSYITPRLF